METGRDMSYEKQDKHSQGVKPERKWGVLGARQTHRSWSEKYVLTEILEGRNRQRMAFPPGTEQGCWNTAIPEHKQGQFTPSPTHPVTRGL